MLLLPLVGFRLDVLRIEGTIAAIERTLMQDGLWHATTRAAPSMVCRETKSFLACSFWLADN